MIHLRDDKLDINIFYAVKKGIGFFNLTSIQIICT